MEEVVLETPASAPAEAASGGMPQLNIETWPSQIFWLIVTFGVLYFVLSRFILPQLGRGINDRNDRIADDLDLASRMNREAQQAELAYETSLKDARAKAHNISETTRKSVASEIESEVEASNVVLDRQQAAAEVRISEMRAKAMSNVDSVAADVTQVLFEKATGKSVTAAKVKSALKALGA